MDRFMIRWLGVTFIVRWGCLIGDIVVYMEIFYCVLNNGICNLYW